MQDLGYKALVASWIWGDEAPSSDSGGWGTGKRGEEQRTGVGGRFCSGGEEWGLSACAGAVGLVLSQELRRVIHKGTEAKGGEKGVGEVWAYLWMSTGGKRGWKECRPR